MFLTETIDDLLRPHNIITVSIQQLKHSSLTRDSIISIKKITFLKLMVNHNTHPCVQFPAKYRSPYMLSKYILLFKLLFFINA